MSEPVMKDKADLNTKELDKVGPLSNKTTDNSKGKKHKNYLQRAARRSKAGFEKVHLELMRKYNSTDLNGKASVKRASFRASRRKYKERKHSDSSLIAETSTFKSYLYECDDGYRSDPTVVATAHTKENTSLEQNPTLPSTARKYKSSDALNTIHKDTSQEKQVKAGSTLSKLAMLHTMQGRKTRGNGQTVVDNSKGFVTGNEISTNTESTGKDDKPAALLADEDQNQIYDTQRPTVGKITTDTNDRTLNKTAEQVYMPMNSSSSKENLTDEITDDYIDCDGIDKVPTIKALGERKAIAALSMQSKGKQAQPGPDRKDVGGIEIKQNGCVVKPGNASTIANETESYVTGDNDTNVTRENDNISRLCDNTTTGSTCQKSDIPDTVNNSQESIAHSGDKEAALYDTPPQTVSNIENAEKTVDENAEDEYIQMDSSSENILECEDGDYINFNDKDLSAHKISKVAHHRNTISPLLMQKLKGQTQKALNRTDDSERTKKDVRYGTMPGKVLSAISNKSVHVASGKAKEKTVNEKIAISNIVDKIKANITSENSNEPDTINNREAKSFIVDEQQTELYDTPPNRNRKPAEVDKAGETTEEELHAAMDDELLDNEAEDYTNVKELLQLKRNDESNAHYINFTKVESRKLSFQSHESVDSEADVPGDAKPLVSRTIKKKCIDKNREAKSFIVDEQQTELYDTPPNRNRKPAEVDKAGETTEEELHAAMDDELLDNEAENYTNVKELLQLKRNDESNAHYINFTKVESRKLSSQSHESVDSEADVPGDAKPLVSRTIKKKCIDKIEESRTEGLRDYDYIDCDAVVLVPPPKGHKQAKVPSQRNTIPCFPSQGTKERSKEESGRGDVCRSANEADYKANTMSADCEPEFYSYTVEKVVEVLQLCALPRMASICQEEQLDGAFFRGLEKEVLCKEPFIMNWFYIGKFFRIVNGWRPKR